MWIVPTVDNGFSKVNIYIRGLFLAHNAVVLVLKAYFIPHHSAQKFIYYILCRDKYIFCYIHNTSSLYICYFSHCVFNCAIFVMWMVYPECSHLGLMIMHTFITTDD
jgi:hypothetical protein